MFLPTDAEELRRIRPDIWDFCFQTESPAGCDVEDGNVIKVGRCENAKSSPVYRGDERWQSIERHNGASNAVDKGK